MRRPKIGLLLLTAEWFTQIGASQGSFQALPQRLEEDAARIEHTLRAELDIVNPGVLATLSQVDAAIAQLKNEDVDGLIVCQITWGEDRLVIRVAQDLGGLPWLLWCYSPFGHLPETMTMVDLFRGSGPVGAVQASGPLKRLGKSFSFAFGSQDNPATIKKIVAFGKAAKVARELKTARIGVLPYRCDQMTGTYVDEFRLKRELGPELKYISVAEYRELCDRIPDTDVQAFVRDLRATYPISDTTTEAGLFKGARASMGLAEVVETYDLEALALEDISEELHRMLGLRPCLYVPALFDRAVVSMEAEVGGAVALVILKGLSGLSPMYTEIFTVDEVENAVLIGHAGIHDVHLAESPDAVLIEPDGEYVESEPDSAWMRFRAKKGQVTLLSVFCDVERFKLVIAAGEALGGNPKLLGSPHAYVKLATPLPEFFEKAITTGMTQHWALVHADVVAELAALGDLLSLDTVIL